MSTRIRAAVAGGVLSVACASATANVSLTAGYSFSFQAPIQTTSFFAGATTEDTARFNGQRLDQPPGPATDLSVPAFFTAYCVEVDTFILNPSSHKVFPLLGSTTDVVGGGGSPAVFFDAARTERMERLWGTYAGGVSDAFTSAAFQLAVWEICYDTDATLAGPGAYFVDAGQFQAGITDLAESWLTQVRSAAILPRQTLMLLSAPGTQDIITTPTPGATVLLGLAGLAGVRRRR